MNALLHLASYLLPRLSYQLETKFETYKEITRDQDQDLGLLVSRPRPRPLKNELELRDLGLEITTLVFDYFLAEYARDMQFHHYSRNHVGLCFAHTCKNNALSDAKCFWLSDRPYVVSGSDRLRSSHNSLRLSYVCLSETLLCP